MSKLREKTIQFLRKEAKAIHKTLPPHLGITEDQIFQKLKQEWKQGDRVEDAYMNGSSVENYQEIRKRLTQEGFSFYSETDTEVIPNLIQFYMDRGGDFTDSCKKAFSELEGNFAILSIHASENLLIASRKGSPLVIGVGEGEFFAASDIPAFLEHTKKVIYLYDSDFVGDNARNYLSNFPRVYTIIPPSHDLTDFFLSGGDLRSWIASVLPIF